MFLDGDCDHGFDEVREMFISNFEAGREIGAPVAVYWQGKLVVDLAAGVRDRASAQPYSRATLQPVFSVTKGITAGRSEHAGGAGNSRPRRGSVLILAGVCPSREKPYSGPLAADPSVRLCHWNFVTEALAAQKPDWEPGSKHGYHSLTYGFLVGEIIRRVSGRSVGQFVASEIARPLGVDFFIGLPTDQKPRVAAPTVQVEPGKPAKPADSGPYAARVFNWFHHRFRCWTSTAMIYGPLKFPQPMALERAIGRQNLRRDYRGYRRHASTVGFLDEHGARATMTRVRRSEGVENALGLGYLLPTATRPLFWTESNWQPI